MTSKQIISNHFSSSSQSVAQILNRFAFRISEYLFLRKKEILALTIIRLIFIPPIIFFPALSDWTQNVSLLSFYFWKNPPPKTIFFRPPAHFWSMIFAPSLSFRAWVRLLCDNFDWRFIVMVSLQNGLSVPQRWFKWQTLLIPEYWIRVLLFVFCGFGFEENYFELFRAEIFRILILRTFSKSRHNPGSNPTAPAALPASLFVHLICEGIVRQWFKYETPSVNK